MGQIGISTGNYMIDPSSVDGNYRLPSGGLGWVRTPALASPEHFAPPNTRRASIAATPPHGPAVSPRAGTRRAACPCRAALMAPPPPGYVPVLKRRSENRVLEDVKKVALKHCDGLVKEFVECTKVRVSRLGCVVCRFRWASTFLLPLLFRVRVCLAAHVVSQLLLDGGQRSP